MEANRQFIMIAIERARSSKPEPGRKDPTPIVGAALVRDGKVIGDGFRGMTGEGDHAECGLLTLLTKKGETLSNCEMYVTLEPCTQRSAGITPCARLIVDCGIRRVCIGILDPNRRIQGDGYWLMNESGVEVSFFPVDLARIVMTDNKPFIDFHRSPRWLPSPEFRRLDDWYHIINGIYLDKNVDKDPIWVFAHLVEVIAGLSLLATEKRKPEFSIENYLPKAIAWWLALCSSVGVRSAEELLWMKFPAICAYCQLPVHVEKRCKEAKSLSENLRVR